MDKKELVWSFIKDREYFPMKFKEIADAMEVPAEDVETLGLILDELTFEHKIIKDFNGFKPRIDNLYLVAYKQRQKVI